MRAGVGQDDGRAGGAGGGTTHRQTAWRQTALMASPKLKPPHLSITINDHNVGISDVLRARWKLPVVARFSPADSRVQASDRREFAFIEWTTGLALNQPTGTISAAVSDAAVGARMIISFPLRLEESEL